MISTRYAASTLALMASSLPSYALAQTAADAATQATPGDQAVQTTVGEPAAGDIVVTARRRAESNLSVPVAVSAISALTIERAQVTDISRINNIVPNVVIARGASGAGGTIGIRGVSSSYSDAGVDSPVSISLDGAQFSRPYISAVATFDLSSVQVLKGPQSLFFGKNSPAGVISLTSADPGSSFEASVRAGYEFVADERYAEVILSGPITDSFGARLAVRGSKLSGYFDNVARPIANPFGDASLAPTYPGSVTNRRTPNAETYAGRLTLAFKPAGEDFEAKLKLFYSHLTDNEATGGLQTIFCNGGGNDDGGRIDPYDDCRANGTRSVGNVPVQLARGVDRAEDGRWGSKRTTFLGILDMEKNFGDVSVSSLTSYFSGRNAGTGCFTYSLYCRQFTATFENQDIFSQEIRIRSDFDSPLNFMVGGYFESSERVNSSKLSLVSAAAVTIPDVRNGNTYVVQPYLPTDGETLSAFGQLVLRPFDRVELTAGARFTHETKKGIIGNIYRNESSPTAVAAIAPVGVSIYPGFDDTDLSPEATATFRVTPTQTLYAAYRSGYKSGGFSTPSSAVTNAIITLGARGLEFGAEKAKGGEIGYKAELLSRRLIVNADIFYYQFKGLQRSALDVSINPPSYQVRNAASAVTKGVEVDLSYEVANGLSLNAAAAYNRARYSTFNTAPCYTPSAPGCTLLAGREVLDLSGAPLSRAPEWTALAGFTWELPLTGAIGVRLSGDARYSDSYTTQEDGNPNAVQADYTKINLGVAVHSADNKWELAFFGRNVTNKYVVLYSAAKVGSVAVAGKGPDLVGYVDRPRELTVQGTLRF